MTDLLIVYSTTDGHTRKICQRLQAIIEKRDVRVVLKSIEDAKDIALAPFDGVVLGASIRYGKHDKQVFDFANSNRKILESKPSAFFSVNLVARKPEKSTPETNPYLRKFIAQIVWQPEVLAVFPGKLDYPKYGLFDRLMIRLIMWMTNGPTDSQAVVEFTNWEQVEIFGQRICDMHQGE